MRMNFWRNVWMFISNRIGIFIDYAFYISWRHLMWLPAYDCVKQVIRYQNSFLMVILHILLYMSNSII